MKIPFSIAIVAALLAVPALAQNQKPIKAIRVERLVAEGCCGQDLADLVTAKLISHLVEHGVVVLEGDSDHPTDAVLHVTYTMRTLPPFVHIEGPVRLTDMSGRVIWAGEARSLPFSHSASSSFAEVVARQVEDFLFKQESQ
jgi:hypothetical protein